MGTGADAELSGAAPRARQHAGTAGEPAERPVIRKTPQSDGYRIYLMRHGIAVNRDSTEGADDAARALTDKGRTKMQRIAKGLKEAQFEVDWIICSPLVRARETAEIIWESLPATVPLDSCVALEPGGSAEDLMRFLSKQPDRSRVLLVGHEPDLSTLASSLIGAPRPANLAFKKGGCCLIEFGQFPWAAPGLLVWWLTPRLLRAMGRD